MPGDEASSSSAELVAGFRIERRLGDGLWEATQPELGRRVALRLLPPGTSFDAAQWPERRGVVALFAVVATPTGTYVATQLVPGARTLTELRAVRPSRRRRWIAAAAETLDGVVHGRLTADDVLIGPDGSVWLTGFGQAPEGASAADDHAALQRLRPARGRSALVVPAAAALIAAIALVVVLLESGGADEPAPAPPVTAGATAIGSTLTAGAVATVDCEGLAPGGGSRPCTLMQTDLPGRPLAAPFRGLLRGFAVRGASGRLRVQILRATPGGFVQFNHTRTVTINDPDVPEFFGASRSFPKGARFAVELEPGGAIGMRRGIVGATTTRFFGPVRGAPPRTEPVSGRGEELLLRVDIARRPR